MTIRDVLTMVWDSYSNETIKNYVVDGVIKMGWTEKSLNTKLKGVNIIELYSGYVEIHMFTKEC